MHYNTIKNLKCEQLGKESRAVSTMPQTKTKKQDSKINV